MGRIIRVDAFGVEIPVIQTFVFASGTAGQAGGTVTVPFVRIADDEGHVGWGEGRPSPSWNYETADSILGVIRDHLGPAVLGLPVTDRCGLHERMRKVIGLGPSTGMPVAKAAVDIAVHDLAARAANQTLRAYLGGADDRCEVQLSYTVTAHTVAAAREQVRAARDSGFRHMNFKVAVEATTDIEVAAAIRDAAGPDSFVWADANQGLSLGQARTVAQRLHEVGVDVLEQPLRADLPHLMPALRQATSIPLAADESTVGPSDFLRLAAAGAVDYLVIKLTRSGGIWPTLQQAAIAEAAGARLLVSGLTDALITKVAACQSAAALGFTGPAGLNGSQFMDDSEFFPAKAEMEHDGVVHLNAEPGLGIDVDEDAVRRAATSTVSIKA
jgi:L-alanine-DL-glutamate epimerase-like enolase superfamily enzyme